MTTQGDLLHIVTNDNLSPRRIAFGRLLIWGSAGVLVLTASLQTLQASGGTDLGFTNWRPTLYAYTLWAICLCWGQVLTRGEQGKRVLFVLRLVRWVSNPPPLAPATRCACQCPSVRHNGGSAHACQKKRPPHGFLGRIAFSDQVFGPRYGTMTQRCQRW